MDLIKQILEALNSVIWGVPMLIILFGTHLFMTFRLRFIQRYTPLGMKFSVTPDEAEKGEVSQFGALATALAATIGTGNIIGVSTAISLGGPGAVFWTWVTGLFGMATKYSEAMLSMSFRSKNERGEVVGGPMYVLEKALKLKWLAVLFAVFTVLATFGAGCTVQSHAISEVLSTNYNVPTWFSGVVIMLFAGFVIIGGVKKISKVCERLVPFMALFYIIGCLVILAINWEYILPAIKTILTEAFSWKAVGGGFAGRAMLVACRYGVARGLFSNESGLGTAPIIAATAKSKNACRQALVSMTGTFYDTIIVCAMTGLVVVSSSLHFPESFAGLQADRLTMQAFSVLPQVGGVVLTISLTIFAFTTILGWAYYGERAIEYLFGYVSVKIYRVVFLVVLVVGSVTSLDVIWSFSDLMNGMMAIPNLVSILILSGFIVRKTRYYLWEDHLEEAETDAGHSRWFGRK